MNARGLLLCASLAACSRAPDPAPSPEVVVAPEPPPYTGTNLVDSVLHPRFWRAQHTPVLAAPPELCRRLYLDLAGRAPTREEIERDCASKPIGELITTLQASERYRLVSERHWRDRLDTDDVRVNWRYLKSLYALVGELHRGRVDYASFLTRAAAHPGFVMARLQPEERARAAYRAFLGREATDAEAADLASLYRPWIPREEPDPEIPYTPWLRPWVFPIVCQPILHCRARLFGGGEVDLRGSGMTEIAYEALEPWQREALEEPGRMIGRAAIAYEAAADEILNRLLGWSDGGRFPREPGIVLPEVREALAAFLRGGGAYPDAERVVLESWLYRQAATVAPDGHGDDPAAPLPAIWATGPVKPMNAEQWLDTAMRLTPPFGLCDPRYTDGFTYFYLGRAVQTGTISPARYEELVRRVHVELLESRVPLRRDERTGIMIPDFRYAQVARTLGGCPGFQAQRAEARGMAFAFTQEALAEQICQANVAVNAAPSGDLTIGNILRHQMGLLFGREPEDAERMAFEAARTRCTGADCTTQAAVNSTCVALLGSAEALFY